jgi:hypothetical protein
MSQNTIFGDIIVNLGKVALGDVAAAVLEL